MKLSFDELPDVLSAKDVADYLGISRSNVYTLMNQKDFPTMRIGIRSMVRKDYLLEWMTRHTNQNYMNANENSSNPKGSPERSTDGAAHC